MSAPDHAHKKRRLDINDAPAISRRSTDNNLSLEVDIMILDYTAYQATLSCIASRSASGIATSAVLRHNLAMADSFTAIFKARHAEYVMDNELRFRLLLLKFVILFTQRLTRNPTTPSKERLQELRKTNLKRARLWRGRVEDSAPFGDTDTKVEQQEIERNRAHVLCELNVPAEDEEYEDAFYGTSVCLTLLDLLPLFMRVSALRDAMTGSEDKVTELFLCLAAEFMLQACLEQILVVGTKRDLEDLVGEAFAWGFNKHGEGEDEEINTMFTDPVYDIELQDWKLIKEAYYFQLLPQETSTSTDAGIIPSSPDAMERIPASDTIDRLKAVAAKYPIARFERSILDYLSAMAGSISKPMLVQLEDGELDSMSRQETQQFLQDCGLSVARFFETPIGFKTP